MQIDVLDVLLTTVFANHIRGGSPFGNIGFNGGRSNPPRERKCFYWGGGMGPPRAKWSSWGKVGGSSYNRLMALCFECPFLPDKIPKCNTTILKNIHNKSMN